MTEDRPTASSMIGRLYRRRGLRQFVKFAIVGTSGFLVNLLVFTLLQHPLTVDERARWYYLLFSVGFLAGGASNYALNRIWTFRSNEHPVREGAKFMSVSVIALVVGLVTSFLVSPWLGTGHKAWFTGTLAGIFINFFVNKYWTFKSAQ